MGLLGQPKGLSSQVIASEQKEAEAGSWSLVLNKSRGLALGS